MLNTLLPAFAVLWLAVPTGAVAVERVTFANGGTVELAVRAEGGEVILAGPDRDYCFKSAEITSREATRTAEAEWPRRRDAALASGSAAEQVEAARWALMNGLTDDAEALARSAHGADPGNDRAARMVGAWDHLKKPLPDPDPAGYRRHAGQGARVATGPHVVLAHHLGDAEAAGRIRLMEQVVATYFAMLADWGFDLRLPEEKLVVIWFPTRSAYDAYLKASGDEGFLGTRGHYHPIFKILAVCDARSEFKLRSELFALERMESREPAAPDYERRRLLFELERARIELGTAAHELVHALVAQCGLEPRFRQFPYWLHEGFAMQFEGIADGRWAGVCQPLPERLSRLKRLGSSARLEAILSDRFFGRGADPKAYALAWSLVGWMMAERPDEFRAFLGHLRDAPAPPDGPADSVAAFRAAFGRDLGPAEAAWRKWMQAR